MDAIELRSWLTTHCRLFPEFRTWWIALPVQSREAIRDEWLAIVAKTTPDDAAEVSRKMLAGSIDRVPHWENNRLAAAVAKAAAEFAYERWEAERRNQPVDPSESTEPLGLGGIYRKLVEAIDAGGDPAEIARELLPARGDGKRYSCPRCLDSGYATVWGERAIKAVLVGQRDGLARFPTAVVPCDCVRGSDLLPRGDKPPKDWHGFRTVQYDAGEHCYCRAGDTSAVDNQHSLLTWVDLQREKRNKRTGAFDAWNRESAAQREF